MWSFSVGVESASHAVVRPFTLLLHSRFSKLIYCFFLTTWFGSIFPILYFVGAIGRFACYAVDKYNLLYVDRIIPHYDEQLPRRAYFFLLTAVLAQQTQVVFVDRSHGSGYVAAMIYAVVGAYFTQWSYNDCCAKWCRKKEFNQQQLNYQLSEPEFKRATAQPNYSSVVYLPPQPHFHRTLDYSPHYIPFSTFPEIQPMCEIPPAVRKMEKIQQDIKQLFTFNNPNRRY